MSLRQSRAFVLRCFPLSESASGVVLFSEEQGKIKAWAHGARKPKSRFGSSLDLGNEVRLEWRQKEDQEWVNLSHAELLASALPLVRRPLSASALHYYLGLVDIFAPALEARPRLYRLLGACLGALAAGIPPLLSAVYFEAWLLRLSGLYPRPGTCACGAAFEPGGAVFRQAGPAWFCPACAPATRRGDTRLSPAALSLLGAIWTSSPTGVGERFRGLPGAAAGELFRLHHGIVGEAAGREIPGRAGMARVLKREAP